MPAYSDSANAVTRAALQNVVATPGNLQSVSQASTSTSTTNISDANNSSSVSAANLVTSEVYRNTNMVASINNSLNANDYISRLVNKENARINNIEDLVRNEQYKLRGKLLAYKYLYNYYYYGTTLVIVTLIVSILMLLLAALWRCGKIAVAPFVLLVAFFLVAYAFIVIIVSSDVASRSPSSWDRLRWTVRNQKKLLSDA